MTEIARGEINITLNDGEALAEMERLRASVHRDMDSIGRARAVAKVDADSREFDARIKRAKLDLDVFRGLRADAKLGADKKELDRKIAESKREIAALKGHKAIIQIEAHGDRTLFATNEAAAKQRQEIARLNQEWVKHSKAVENAAGKHSLFREREAELRAEEERAAASLNVVEKRLQSLGQRVPPAHMRVDVDNRGLSTTRLKLTRFAESIEQRLQHLGATRINLGPITTSFRGLLGILGTLGPIVTSLGGGLVSLAGVLTTGIAGAAAVSSGVIAGLVTNLGGVVFALKPAIADFKVASTATTAYHKAVLKYGEGSKQAKKAQDQMNMTLKSVSPLTRQAAKEAGQLRSHWDAMTSAVAKRDFGRMMTAGLKTANALLPTFAANTNRTMSILAGRTERFSKALRTPAAIGIFDSLGKSANTFLGPALDAVGHLAAAFGHVAESAARIFAGPAGQGINRWAAGIDKATQPGLKLDATITRLGQHAADVFHLFGATGRLLATVLSGSADAGDDLVVSLTRVFNRWNAFLRTEKGQRSMSDFFRRSADDVKALFSALAPLIAAFVRWSSLLAPFTTGLLKGVAFVGNLLAGFTKLVGLGGPLAALGATLGAMFAVTRIGAFVGMLVKAVTLARELGALGTLKGLASGSFFKTLSTSGMAQGGAAAGAEIRTAMVAGGAAAAAEIRAAMAAGGLIAAEEQAAGGAAAGAAGAAGGAAAGAEAGALSGLMGGRLAKSLKFIGTRVVLPIAIAAVIDKTVLGGRAFGNIFGGGPDDKSHAAAANTTLKNLQRSANAAFKAGDVETLDKLVNAARAISSEYPEASKQFQTFINTVHRGSQSLQTSAINKLLTGQGAPNSAALNKALRGVPGAQRINILMETGPALRQLNTLTGALQRMGQGRTAIRILTNAKDAGTQIAAMKAIIRGVPPRVVMNIITNARDARVRIAALIAVSRGVPPLKVLRIIHNAPTAKTAVQRLHDAVNKLPPGKKLSFSANVNAAIEALQRLGDVIQARIQAAGTLQNLLQSDSSLTTDLSKVQTTRPGGGRRGGVVSYAGGGMVQTMVAPGEVAVLPSGQVVPVGGLSQAGDHTMSSFPQDTAILTGHGQSLVAAGASLGEALFSQIPHFAKGGWLRTGFTTDIGGAGKQTYNRGMSFAELLQAGTNRGLRAHSLTHMLGLRGGTYGMPYPAMGGNATPILARHGPGSKAYRIVKSDVGSGQPGDSRYTIDLHGGAAHALHVGGKGFIDVAPVGTAAFSGSESSRTVKDKIPITTFPRLTDILAPTHPGAYADAFEAAKGLIPGQSFFYGPYGTDSDALKQALEAAATQGKYNTVSRTIPGAKGVAKGKGGYTFPLPDFGTQGRTDRGQDMEARHGHASTVALGSGVVTNSGLGFPGMVIKLDSGEFAGQHVFYGHNAAAHVRQGRRVRAGQAVGATGGAPYAGATHTEIGFMKGFHSQSGSWSGPGSSGGQQMNRLLHALRPDLIKLRRQRGGGLVGAPTLSPSTRPGAPVLRGPTPVAFATSAGSLVQSAMGAKTTSKADAFLRSLASMLDHEFDRAAGAVFTARLATLRKHILALRRGGVTKGERSLYNKLTDQFKDLQEQRDQAAGLTFAGMEKLKASIFKQIRKLRVGGLTPTEQVAVGRLQSSLEIIDDAIGERLGKAAGAIANAVTFLDASQHGMENLFQRQIIAQGGDPSGTEFSRRQVGFLTQTRLPQLLYAQNQLLPLIAQAKRDNDPKVLKDLQDQFAELGVSIDDTKTQIDTLNQAISHAELVDWLQNITDEGARIGGAQHLFENTQRINLLNRGIDPSSGAGLATFNRADLDYLQNTVLPAQNAEMGRLQEGYWTAVARGDQDAIRSFGSAIDDLNGGISDTNLAIAQLGFDLRANAAEVAANTMTLSTARADLYRSMGSNFYPLWSSPFVSQRGYYGPNPSSSLTQITVNNQFATQPADPHTWSNQLGWELQAAM